MEQKNLFKIIAGILLVIMIVNAALFFNQLSGPISTSKAGLSMFRTSMYAFMIINLVITVFLVLLVWRSSQKMNDGQPEPKFEEMPESSEDEEQEDQKREEEKRRKEEKRIEQKIDNILNDLDEERDLERYGKKLLSQIAEQESVVQGLFFLKNYETEKFLLKSEFAFYGEHEVKEFAEGDGLSGQVAYNRNILKIDDIPDGYVKVYSGLGKSAPRYLLLIPVVKNEETIALIELAAFEDFDTAYERIYKEVADKVGNHLETLTSHISV